MPRIQKIIPVCILVLCLGSIYLATLAPGVTWANAGADGGDLITAAATGGVAHPTGYPTYLLTAALFQKLPWGTLAFRTNLLSLAGAVLAALLVYGTVTWLPGSPGRGNAAAGITAGLMFGLAPLVWSQAVIAEVYTLHAFFTALVVFLAAWIPHVKKPRVWDCLLGAVLGLAIGNHLTSVFLVPAALVRSRTAKRWPLDTGAAARRAAGMGAGLLVYAALPLRALAAAPVNWGNPVTLKQFAWLVTGDLYTRRLLDMPFEAFLPRLQQASVLLLRQFELPGIALALIGLIYFFIPSNLHFFTIWNAFIFSAFALLYRSPDSYLYLIPVVISVSVWIGMGVGGLFNPDFHNFRGTKPLVLVTLGLFLIIAAVFRWPQVDASRDLRAEQFGAAVMAGAPQGAILLAEDDQSIFTLWYFHYALKQRQDLVVLADGLMHFPWYNETLRVSYPSASWPEGLFWPQTVAEANPGRVLCSVSLSKTPLVCGEVQY